MILSCITSYKTRRCDNETYKTAHTTIEKRASQKFINKVYSLVIKVYNGYIFVKCQDYGYFQAAAGR